MFSDAQNGFRVSPRAGRLVIFDGELRRARSPRNPICPGGWIHRGGEAGIRVGLSRARDVQPRGHCGKLAPPKRKGKSMNGIVFVSLMVVSLQAAAAQPPVSSPTETPDRPQAQAGDLQEKKVCEVRKKAGSNRPERVCTTVAERDAAKAKAQDDLHRIGRCGGGDSICIGDF